MPVDIERARDLAAQGCGIVAAARQLKISYTVLRRTGIQFPDTRSKLGPRTEALIASYLAGGTIRSVALEYGITFQRVQQILARQNVKRRPVGHPA